MAGPHIPARNVVGDQVLAADTNGSGEFVQHVSEPDTTASGTITANDAVVAAPAGGGALLSGTPTAGSYVAMACSGGESSWTVSLVGSNFGTGGTVYFEASVDSTNGVDGNWTNVNGRQTGVLNTVLVGGATSAGIYRGNTAGVAYFRVRIKGATVPPSVAVSMRSSSGQGAMFLNASIPAGTNNIGDVDIASALPAGTNDIGNVYISGSDPIAATTGTITTSSGTVTSSDVNAAGTVLVMVYGTHAGINLTFEGLSSAGGNTTWMPIAGTRLDGSRLEYTTGVLVSNSAVAWRFPVARVNQFRVRSTAYTSGTLNVIVDPAVPFGEPVVSSVISKPANNVDVEIGTATAGVTGVTTEALLTMVPTRDGVSAGTSTTHTPTAGKNFKLQGFSIAVANGAATQNGLRCYLRMNPSGTVTATSPIIAFLGISAPNAVSGGMTGTAITMDRDIKSGWSFGVTQLAAIASGSMHAHIWGYEY